TSMMTPPLSISARPDFTRKVPVSRSTAIALLGRPVRRETPGQRVYRRVRRRLRPVGGAAGGDADGRYFVSETETVEGTSSTHVRPGRSATSVPSFATYVVVSSRLERSQRAATTCPSSRM